MSKSKICAMAITSLTICIAAWYIGSKTINAKSKDVAYESNIVTQKVNNVLVVDKKEQSIATNVSSQVSENKSQTLSETVNSIIKSPHKQHRPPLSLLNALTENDKQSLIQEFNEEPLTNRTLCIWALTYLGGDDVREEFCKVLEADYGSNYLTLDEVYVMDQVAQNIGYLAKEDDVAFDYLIKHYCPDDWNGLRKWNTEKQRDLNSIVAAAIIKGIGNSGIEGAHSILNDVFKWESVNQEIAGALVEAQFKLSLGKTMDRKAFVRLCCGPKISKEYDKWISTDEGKKWEKWLIRR